MRMVRKQFYITPEQEERLKDAAARLDLTEADLIRRAIDAFDLGEDQKSLNVALDLLDRVTERWESQRASGSLDRAEVHVGHPRPLDDQAWEDELAFIRERARLLPMGGSTLKWHREDSYD